MKLSSIGFGCYRVDYNFKDHYDALSRSLLSGVNVIDTSANYTDGRSETLVGNVLNDLISENKIIRDEIILVTKGGYIQGQNYRNALKLKTDGAGFKEVVELSEGLWHCIEPEFLEDQIRSQLGRLKQNYADVYLLHNPEYYLKWEKGDGVSISDAREIYYERIRKAFVFLEDKVKEGIIKSYGISSNTFPDYSDNYEFTSLERIINIANSISDDNHFKFIQLPFNLFETGAVSAMNQINNTETVLELSERSGIKVLINRPLNAITSTGMVRLADFKAEAFEEKDFIKQMKLVTLMEDDFLTEKTANEDLTDEEHLKLKKNLNFGKTIDENWKFFGSIEHYNDVVSQVFVPRIDFLINFVETKISDENAKDFFNRYIKECYKLLNFVSNYYKLRAEKRSRVIHNLIDVNLDAKFQSLTLSQKTILILKSVKGVDCILVGMRKEDYVDDAVKVLNTDKVLNAKEIIMNVSAGINI